MPTIASIGTYTPPYTFNQTRIEQFTKTLFHQNIPELERLLKVFNNGEIKERHFSVPLTWHETNHTFEERNTLYLNLATTFSVQAIENCLNNKQFLNDPLLPKEIDALIFISSTGIATPSIDARIMNQLGFSDCLKRIPIWGLGCGGGAAGLSRAFDYCKAHPYAKVLVVCAELCSLTFQPNDFSKSNVIGASLFADGVACALVVGDEVTLTTNKALPSIISTASKWLPNSENIMGWELKNNGLHVVFSKSIPSIIEKWLGSFIDEFLQGQSLSVDQIQHFVAHPGGKKVLQAYEKTLNISPSKTSTSKHILEHYGNMSSPTILYVLEQFMLQNCSPKDFGLLVALGPGFSSEVLLIQWRD